MHSFNTITTKKQLLTLLILVVFVGGSITACGKAKDTQTLISEAIQYQQEGDDKAAIIQLKNALQKSSDNSEARYLLGVLYNKSGDPLSAEKELNKALSLGMAPEKVLPVLGSTLFDLGEFQQLLDKTEQLSTVSNTPEISILRANALLALGKLPEAKDIFEQILSEKPDAPDALIGLAKYSLSQKDLEAATQFTEQAVTKNPENADAWLFKADLLRAQNKIDQALIAYDQVIQLKPDSVSAHVNRATIQISKREFDAAKTSLDAARKVSPGALVITYTQALLDFNQEEHAEALASLQQILSVMPEHLPSVLLAGAVQFSLGSPIQAEQYLEKYLQRIPDNLYARKLMTSILLKNGRTQQAIDILVPTLKAVKEDPQLFALAGEAYMKAQNFTQATEYFEKANELVPNNAKLHTALGISKLAQGDKDHGIAELELATNLDAKSSRAGVVLALTHLRLKEFDKAMLAVDGLEKTDANNPLFQNLKGGVYMGKKDFANARASFNKALSLHPDYFPAITNLARLDIQDKKPDVAKKRLEAVLKKDDKNIQAMNALASLAQSQGNVEEATTWLELASSKNPDELQPAIQLTTHYLRTDKKKKALVLAQKLYGTYPNEPRVIEALGQTQLENDNNAAALESYEKLAAKLPGSAQAQLQIASIHAAMKNHSAASMALKKALKLKPDYLEAQVAQIKLAVQDKNIKEALSLSKKIQTQHDKLPIGFMLEGDLLIQQQKPVLALKAYEQALSITQNGPLMIKMHVALSQTGKEKEANSRLTKWLNKHPNDSVSRLYLANNYLNKQQYDAAIEQYELILQQHPEHGVTLNNLAWLYQQKKDPRALEFAEKVYKQAPEAPAVLDTLGWILVTQGDIERALPLLLKATSLAPDTTEIQYHYAFALVKSGDKIKARSVLEKLLASGKPFPMINEVKALLAQIQ